MNKLSTSCQHVIPIQVLSLFLMPILIGCIISDTPVSYPPCPIPVDLISPIVWLQAPSPSTRSMQDKPMGTIESVSSAQYVRVACTVQGACIHKALICMGKTRRAQLITDQEYGVSTMAGWVMHGRPTTARPHYASNSRVGGGVVPRIGSPSGHIRSPLDRLPQNILLTGKNHV